MRRKDPLITGHYYHIFNRGVNKGKTFFSDGDYYRFLRVSSHYNRSALKFSDLPLHRDTVSSLSGFTPRVEILAYSLMPNHFHFLIKQLEDNGITWYMQHLVNSYSHYIHTKYKRLGPLFTGPFKNVWVETEEQLVHLSRYIHLNPLVSGLVGDLKDYRWSSYLAYISVASKDELCNPEAVLRNFRTKKDYERFVLDQADYAKKLEEIKHLALDVD